MMEKMKRIMLAVAAVAVALALGACRAEELVEPENPETPETKGLIFTAVTESAEVSTKTALDGSDLAGYSVLWQVDDAITIVDNAATPNVGVYTTGSSGASVSFTSSGTEVVTAPFTAYYPSTIYNGGTPMLPAEQTYVAGNIAGSPMYAQSESSTLSFKNLTGIIRLNLSTELPGIKVSSIALSATQGMSGAFTVTSNAAVVGGMAGVTLNCPGEGVALSSTQTPFHIAVPANTYTGLSITVTTTTGAVQTFTLKSEREVVVGRSEITDITLTANNISTPYDLTPRDVSVPAAEFATVTGSNANSVLTIGEGARVILKDATLKQIVVSGNATLVLSGTNTETTEFNGAAISIADNKTLTIEGTGRLNVDRQWSADYGCIYGPNANLVVNGGTMVLNSNKKAGGNNVCMAVYVKNYTQTGGSVEANGNNTNEAGNAYANGIEAANDVVISGGNLIATGGTGIWVGNDITISGGTVRAEGTYRNYNGATGIVPGGNATSPRGKLTITGGTVTAIGGGGAGGQGPGIGRRSDACGDIIISGGNVTVSSTDGAAAIGTGTNATNVGCNITITSDIERLVVTKGGSAQEHIGRGNASSSVGTVTVDGLTSPSAATLFPNLNLEVSNSGNTWTFTPRAEPLAMVGTLAELKELINAGNDCRVYNGRYVYSDGSIGTDATSAKGRIAYLSPDASTDACSVTGSRILVLALSDLPNPSTAVEYSAAVSACTDEGTAIAGADQTTWRIPTYWDWINMGKSLGNYNFQTLVEAVGMSVDVKYWTSSNSDGGYGKYYVYYSNGTSAYDVNNIYSDFMTRTPNPTLRACFAY